MWEWLARVLLQSLFLVIGLLGAYIALCLLLIWCLFGPQTSLEESLPAESDKSGTLLRYEFVAIGAACFTAVMGYKAASGARNFRQHAEDATCSVLSWTKLAASWPSTVKRTDFHTSVEHLPESVQLYLESVVSERRRNGSWKIVRAVTHHSGDLLLATPTAPAATIGSSARAAAAASDCSSRQLFTAVTNACAIRPAFAWQAKVRVGLWRWLDGLHVYAPGFGGSQDAESGGGGTRRSSSPCVQGGNCGGSGEATNSSGCHIQRKRGSDSATAQVHWRLWSAFAVGGSREAEPGETMLLRWLTETPWYPTALCSRRFVHWEEIDRYAARATVADGVSRASAVFTFSADRTRIVTISGERANWHDPNRPASPWVMELSHYEEMDGYMVPTLVVVHRPSVGPKRQSQQVSSRLLGATAASGRDGGELHDSRNSAPSVRVTVTAVEYEVLEPLRFPEAEMGKSVMVAGKAPRG